MIDGMLSRNRNRLLFSSALILLCLSAAGSYIAILRLLSAQDWVTHTRDVQLALGELSTALSRAGRTRSEYVDSGDPAKLQEYQLAVAQIPQKLAAIKHLTLDNNTHSASVAEMERLIDQRLAFMQESVALKQSGQSTLENQFQTTRSIVAIAGQMDQVFQRMQAQEESLLELRIQRWQSRQRLVAILLAAAFLIAGLLFVLHYRMLNKELAARQEAETSLRTLSGRILQIQDEERRNFSRELHDSMGQSLASAKMNLDVLAASMPGNTLISDSSQLLDEALSETRTISHLLHPPLLDEAGFVFAAKWYVDGFSKRSGIQTTLEIPEDFERLSPRLELAMFRVLQESLTNIHKHAQCSKAAIAVSLTSAHVTLTVRDNGKGITPAVLEGFRNDGAHLGVGLAGMRERIRKLGGHLEIFSDATGTLVSALLPRVPVA